MNVPEFRFQAPRHTGFFPFHFISCVEEANVFAKGMESISLEDDSRQVVVTNSAAIIEKLAHGVHRVTLYGEPALLFWKPALAFSSYKGKIVMLQDPDTISEVAADFGIHRNPKLMEAMVQLVIQMKAEELYPDGVSEEDHHTIRIKFPDGSVHGACNHVGQYIEDLQGVLKMTMEYIQQGTYENKPISRVDFLFKLSMVVTK